MRTRESEEMYLETIYLLLQKKPSLHSVDIVEHLNFAKSSVSRGVNLLKSKGYIDMAGDGTITLTSAGRSKAEDIYEKHRVITQFLVSLGADVESAENNACRMEHIISDDIFELIKKKVGGR